MLKNKTILITGATGGIGRSISFLFAQNNAELVLLGRNHKKLKALKSNILKKHKKTVPPCSEDTTFTSVES